MVSTETSLTLSLLQLKVLMGITENVDLNIVDNLRAYAEVLVIEDAGADALELENNSALRELDYNISLIKDNRKVLKTNFMPTVSFQLTGQYQSLYNLDWGLWNYSYAPSSSFTLAVSIPIFTASNWTKLKTNKVQLLQMADTRENTVNQLTMAVESYSRYMASSDSLVESNREAEEQAEKAVMISAKRYEVGRGTILELNQSETSLTQAELTYNQSIYDYLSNKADLDYTLGRETYLK